LSRRGLLPSTSRQYMETGDKSAQSALWTAKGLPCRTRTAKRIACKNIRRTGVRVHSPTTRKNHFGTQQLTKELPILRLLFVLLLSHRHIAHDEELPSAVFTFLLSHRNVIKTVGLGRVRCFSAVRTNEHGQERELLRPDTNLTDSPELRRRIPCLFRKPNRIRAV
jgi:hypothetical protein